MLLKSQLGPAAAGTPVRIGEISPPLDGLEKFGRMCAIHAAGWDDPIGYVAEATLPDLVVTSD